MTTEDKINLYGKEKAVQYQIRDYILKEIHKTPNNIYAVHGVVLNEKIPRDQIRQETSLLLTKRYIEEGEYNFSLASLGHDVIEAGGYFEYLEREAAQKKLDDAAKKATVEGTIWNRRGIIIAGLFSLAALVVSIIGLNKSNATDEQVKRQADNSEARVNSMLNRVESLMISVQEERDSLHAERMRLRSLEKAPSPKR